MSTELLIAISGTFLLTGVIAAWAATTWFCAHSAEQQRLRKLFHPVHAGAVGVGLLAEQPDPALARLSMLVARSPQEMSMLRRRLTRAGLGSKSAAVYYSLTQLLLPVLLVVIAIAVFGFAGKWWLAAVAAGVLGFAAPSLYVGHRRRVREKAIDHGLPDALDLMTLCVESGTGLDQAISRTADELALAHPELSTELQYLTTELRAGRERLAAFRNFADRTGVEEVRALVSVLTQTDRFGTSIAQALRTHAQTSRTRRRQLAEERAAKVSVKLVFPLALCLFPALYVVCFGPVAITIFRVLLEPGT